MKTSWCGNIFHVTGPRWGESKDDRLIPLTKGQKRRPWIFCVCLNKRLIKQWSCQWLETPRHPCVVTVMTGSEYLIHRPALQIFQSLWSLAVTPQQQTINFNSNQHYNIHIWSSLETFSGKQRAKTLMLGDTCMCSVTFESKCNNFFSRNRLKIIKKSSENVRHVNRTSM